MIVTNVETGWEIVYQAAHALLAGKIATQLRQLRAIPYWPETLAALFEHDDHKTSFGKNVYLTKLGAPRDFTQLHLTARERFEEVQRRIDSGYRKHRWIGMLAGRHAEELYRHETVSTKLRKLIDNERTRRPALLRDLQAKEEALEAAYLVLQWCDRLSLTLCQSGLPAMQRRIEIAPLEASKRYEIWQNEDKTVSVHPWPFALDRFEELVEVRGIGQLVFASDQELEACLKQAAVEDRRWRFHKMKTSRAAE